MSKSKSQDVPNFPSGPLRSSWRRNAENIFCKWIFYGQTMYNIYNHITEGFSIPISDYQRVASGNYCKQFAVENHQISCKQLSMGHFPMLNYPRVYINSTWNKREYNGNIIGVYIMGILFFCRIRLIRKG